MGNILIVQPLAISAVAVSRGSGAANLATPDPKEVWLDSAVSTAANLDIDFGSAQTFDTVLLGYVSPPAAGATWTLSRSNDGSSWTVFKASGALRAIDSASSSPSRTHAFWNGAAQTARYLRIAVTQPASNPVLSAGLVVAGKAFVPTYNKEWGAGRRVIDTGTATALIGGGFANVQGARKAAYNWIFGDLSDAEVDALYELALAIGETSPVLVVEDPAATTGQRNRIHYGQFTGLKAYERRNPKQTRWEWTIEEWV